MSFEKITLEKGMYGVPGKCFTEVLEEMDASENYIGTKLEGMDAYQRQLKRFGIRVGGAKSNTVEKFFTTSQSAALFPEYVARAVQHGANAGSRISDIVATVTKIDTQDYRSITTQSTNNEKTLKYVAEGAELPQVKIRTSEHLIRLQKRGRMIVSSYEALRFQKLGLLTVTLQQIGNHIAVSQMLDAVHVLQHGDGNVSGIKCTTLANSDITYEVLTALWGALSPYTLNTILAGTVAVQKILQIPECKDAQAGLNFHGTGQLISPLGAKLIHVPSMDPGLIIGLDKNCALEMVQAGDVTTEYDKLIDRQLERATISLISGFSRIYPDAAKGIQYP